MISELKIIGAARSLWWFFLELKNKCISIVEINQWANECLVAPAAGQALGKYKGKGGQAVSALTAFTVN